MSEDFWLWAWGAVGALIFAGPGCAMKLNADPYGDAEAEVRRRRLAIELFWLAVITGAAFAQAFTSVVQDLAMHFFKLVLPLRAAGLSIGVSGNFLWPKIMRRLGQKIDGPQPPAGDTP